MQEKLTLYGVLKFIKDRVYMQCPFQHQPVDDPLTFYVNDTDGFIEIEIEEPMEIVNIDELPFYAFHKTPTDEEIEVQQLKNSKS